MIKLTILKLFLTVLIIVRIFIKIKINQYMQMKLTKLYEFNSQINNTNKPQFQ